MHGGQSGFLDEPATAAAMAGFLLRGLECGALDSAELDELVGVDPDTLAALARRRPTRLTCSFTWQVQSRDCAGFFFVDSSIDKSV